MYRIEDQIDEMVNVAEIMFQKMSDSTLPASVARFSKKLFDELQNEGFTREESMSILLTFKLNGNK